MCIGRHCASHAGEQKPGKQPTSVRPGELRRASAVAYLKLQYDCMMRGDMPKGFSLRMRSPHVAPGCVVTCSLVSFGSYVIWNLKTPHRLCYDTITTKQC